MAVEVFRRTVRLPVGSKNTTSIDRLLVSHLEELESDSPHLMQEWIRKALRNEFSRETLVLETAAQKSKEKES